jgi:hypothetical protein
MVFLALLGEPAVAPSGLAADVEVFCTACLVVYLALLGEPAVAPSEPAVAPSPSMSGEGSGFKRGVNGKARRIHPDIPTASHAAISQAW